MGKNADKRIDRWENIKIKIISFCYELHKTMKKLSLLCPRKEEVGSSTALAGRQVP